MMINAMLSCDHFEILNTFDRRSENSDLSPVGQVRLAEASLD